MQAGLAREGLIEALHRSRAEELDDLNREHRVDGHRSLLGAWVAGWTRRAAAVEPEPLPPLVPGEVGITCVGHATVMLRFAQLGILVNPMLGGRLGLVKRAVAPGITPTDAAACELILISHAGSEFLHLPTLRGLPKQATIVVPPRCAGLVSPLGFARVVELGLGSSLVHRGWRWCRRRCGTAPRLRLRVARRRAERLLLRRQRLLLGFSDVGARYRPDLALLPIGGYAPRAFRHEHMSPVDALYAFEDLTARLLVPIRHGAFVLSYERLEEPRRWLARLVADRGLEPYVADLAVGASRKYKLID